MQAPFELPFPSPFISGGGASFHADPTSRSLVTAAPPAGLMHASPTLLFPPPPSRLAKRGYSSEPSDYSFYVHTPKRRQPYHSPREPYPSPPMSTDPPSPKYLSSPAARDEQRYRNQPGNLGPQRVSARGPDGSIGSQLAGGWRPGQEDFLPSEFGPVFSQGRQGMLLTAESDPSPYATFRSDSGPVAPESQMNPPPSNDPGSLSYDSESALAQSNIARKGKAHVPSACANCKKAHIRCDLERPCRRCVSRGTQDTCVDVQHKKRGRPRLREERSRERRRDAVEPAIQKSRSPMRPPLVSSMSLPIRGPSITARHLEHASPLDANIVTSGFGRSTSARTETPGSALAVSPAYALFNIDLGIIRCTPAFCSFVAGGMDVSGRNLLDLVTTADQEKLYRIQLRLREERDVRDPAYLPPIYGGDELRTVQRISEPEIGAATQGFQLHSDSLTIRLPDGQQWRTVVHLQLGRTNVFFGIISLSLPLPMHDRLPPPVTAYVSREHADYESARQRSSFTAQTPLTYSQPGFRRFSSESSVSAGTNYAPYDLSAGGMSTSNFAPRGPVSPTASLLTSGRTSSLESVQRPERQYFSDPSLQLPPIRSSVSSGDSPEKRSAPSEQGSSRRPSGDQREAERRRDSMNIEGMLK